MAYNEDEEEREMGNKSNLDVKTLQADFFVWMAQLKSCQSEILIQQGLEPGHIT